MNDQVKAYFDRMRKIEIKEDISAYGFITLISEGLGDEVRLPITDEDVNFTHRVRIMYKKQGHPDGSLPAPYRILAAKFALLHPSPLHQYNAKSVEENGKNITKIFERHREGGFQWKNSAVATVNDEMRKSYKDATNQTATTDAEGDQKVANWWMEENKDAIHDYVKDKNPSPQVKIILRGNKAVSMAFRKQGKTLGWHVVHNIPINMNEFRQHAEDNGYDEERHSRNILTYTRWKDLLESPELKGKKPNPALDDVKTHEKDFNLKRVKGAGRGYIVPGHQEAGINRSSKFMELYSKDEDFYNYVEKFLTTSIKAAIRFVTGGNKEASIRSGEFGKGDYKISGSADSSDVSDIISVSRLRLMNRTGEIPDENWTNWKDNPELDDWMRRICASTSRTAATRHYNKVGTYTDAQGVKRYTQVQKTDRAVGMGGASDSKGGGERHGGHEDGAASQGGSGDVAIADKGVSGGFTNAKAGDMEGKEMSHSELVAYIQANPKSISSDKWIRSQIKKHAATSPQMKALATNIGLGDEEEGATLVLPDRGRSTNSPSPDYDVRDVHGRKRRRNGGHGYSGGDGFSPVYDKVRESFLSYVARRLGINEMEVVWGSDKKMKPGATLKGGIQVQGAPWTAGGGPNKKCNDVKIRKA
jgi:hypothetical protein